MRLQFNYLIILKVGSKRVEKDKLVSIYKDAVKDPFNFLKIDIDSSLQNKNFSHNISDFYKK